MDHDADRWEGETLADEVVVEPRRGRIDPKLHDPVIFCPVGPMVAVAARLYGAHKKLMPFTPASVYTLKHQERRASLVGPAMGAPAAVYVLERMIAGGARHVIMIGLTGSISSSVRAGDLVVPDAARIEEGVSGHYHSGACTSYPGPRALAAVRAAAEAYGKSYHLGPIWTTDAVFRETKNKVTDYGGSGYLSVEMEASALFTVAHCRGIELAALLVVSDELFDLRWHHGFTRPRFLVALRQASRIARTAAFNLAGASVAPDAAVDGPPPEGEELPGREPSDD
jgi:uridine phosphorylase